MRLLSFRHFAALLTAVLLSGLGLSVAAHPAAAAVVSIQTGTSDSDFRIAYQGAGGTQSDIVVTGDATHITITRQAGDTDPLTLSGGPNFGGPCSGGAGQITCAAGAGSSVSLRGFWLGDGDDHLDSSAYPSGVTVNDGPGDDTYVTGAGFDTFIPASGSDSFSSSAGGGRIQYLGSSDVHANLSTGSFTVSGATDTLLGFTQIITGPGADTITGSAQNDTIATAGGDDVVDGGAGDDTLQTGDGNDTLVGGPGNDTLNPGTGTSAVTVDGGSGSDTVSFDRVDYGHDGDSLDAPGFATPNGVAVDLAAGTATNPATVGAALVSIENAKGSPGSDVLNGTPAGETLDGDAAQGEGSDALNGYGGNDTLIGFGHGGDGNDILLAGGYGDSGDDTIGCGAVMDGGDGSDTLDCTSTGSTNLANTISGGAGDDVIRAGGGTDTISGGAGNDSVDAGAGNDKVDLRDPDGQKDFSSMGGAGACGDGSDEIWTDNGGEEIQPNCEIVHFTPLPDQDADGTPDNADQCPAQAGPADNHGCPKVSPPVLGLPTLVKPKASTIAFKKNQAKLTFKCAVKDGCKPITFTLATAKLGKGATAKKVMLTVTVPPLKSGAAKDITVKLTAAQGKLLKAAGKKGAKATLAGPAVPNVALVLRYS